MQWFSKADPHTCSICVTWELPERQIPSPYSSHTEWETLGAGPCHLLLTSTARVWWVLKFESILKEISPGCSLEGMMLKLKIQYFGHLMQSWVIGKDPDAGRDWGQEEKGTTEDEMAGWHHQLNGCEFECTFTFHFHALEKEMTTHSTVLAWRIPGMAEPGGLPSMGLQRVRHDWSDFTWTSKAPPRTIFFFNYFEWK